MDTFDLFGQTITLAQIYAFVATVAIPALAGVIASVWTQWFKQPLLVASDSRARALLIHAFVIFCTAVICTLLSLVLSVVSHDPMTWSIFWKIGLGYLFSVANYDHFLKS